MSTETSDAAAASTPTGATWPFHYRRMRRSLRRLEALAQGERFGDSRDSDEATDALVHFLQDAYHLMDWIRNDGTTSSAMRAAAEHELFCRGGSTEKPHGHPLGPVVMRLCDGWRLR